MSTEREESFLTEDDEIALLGLGAPALLTLLRRREKATLSRLYAAFRGAQHDLWPVVAEWAAYTDIIRDLEHKIRERDSQKG